ncbi:sialate O-acetylesterase [Flavobacterium nackdongense]|uniref:Sialate O-acetylesterase n=1 Tax=Flavobacterium nackdongense TaxID=2547394 RepID=A0A4P6YHI7_9FLAO|nr:sialate O-acetylesterase [Flavobacterium nackdongense]QBN20317.1 sialate O-acetylesterase [Flavobacterium nackdongense]
MKQLNKYFLVIVFVFIATAAFCQVRLPKLISDGMILQRDTKIKIWGWASANEKIAIDFMNKKHKIQANKQGLWELPLTNLKAGGPYVMKIAASNAIVINDILIGDVWLCSGQSNMAMTVGQCRELYETEIANSENKFIRNFEVPREYEFNTPRTDLSGGSWSAANPANVPKFSAAAYFFAKNIYAKYQIPIGMINSSYGGTPIHAWLSEEALKPFPESYNEIAALKNPEFVKSIENKDLELDKTWNAKLLQTDEGIASKGNWQSNATSIADWQEAKIPGLTNGTALEKANGVVWYKKEIEVTKQEASADAILKLGTMMGADSTYVNGIFVGSTKDQWSSRKYGVLPNTFVEGKNTITIRLVKKRGNGGFVEGLQYQLVTKGGALNLAGTWKYKIGAKMDALPNTVNLRWKPTSLYNAMIQPLKNYAVKGALWYQGEGNSGKPKEYVQLQTALIGELRTVFGNPNMPFLFVQLPNYQKVQPNPADSNWALLRESQLKTLAVPNTGMATTIDLGEWNDIHPHQKEPVGKRLALIAQNLVYGEAKVVCYGPKFESMLVEKGKIILSFATFGSAMQFKGEGTHTNFAIAGEDKKFVWAEAKIENGKIIVSSAAVPNPVAVRYAWADNPEGEKLFNTEGIPASPFRTDSW